MVKITIFFKTILILLFIYLSVTDNACNLIYAENFSGKKEIGQRVTEDSDNKIEQDKSLFFEGWDKISTKNISMDFQEADISSILSMLSEMGNYNIVIHPDIKGKITMKLINVPWQQSFDIILKTFQLEKIIEGKIIRVVTAKAFQDEKRIVSEKREFSGKAENIKTRVFVVNNANVERIKDAIDKSKITSQRGTISSDIRTRSIIIKDIDSVFDEVQKLIDILDKPTQQVLIEAKIVKINSNLSKELGIQWGGGITGITGDRPFIGGGIKDSSQQIINIVDSSGNQAINDPFKNLIVSMPSSASPIGSLAFGYLNKSQSISLGLKISAIESSGEGKIISNPKILTIDNEQAVIKHGAQIPVTTRDQGSAYSTSYRDANLRLTVTPQISPDETIFLKIEVSNDEPDFSRVDSMGNPSINSSSAQTQFLIKNGDTVVIGGIIRTRESLSEQSVPFLSKIPILGPILFKKKSNIGESEEMLIFITPKLHKTINNNK